MHISEENNTKGGTIKDALKGVAVRVNNPIADAAEKVFPKYNNFIVHFGDALKPITDRLGALGEISQATHDPYRNKVAARNTKDSGGRSF